MATDLADLADPAHIALLIMEMQRGVVGDLATFPELARVCADRDVIGTVRPRHRRRPHHGLEDTHPAVIMQLLSQAHQVHDHDGRGHGRA